MTRSFGWQSIASLAPIPPIRQANGTAADAEHADELRDASDQPRPDRDILT
jgi:hypothetical protein